MSELIVDVSPDVHALALRAAELVCNAVSAESAVGALCLSGGGTPRGLYELLAREPFASRMPWARVHWFLGDERFAPPSEGRSNYRMIHEALFSHAPIPERNVHAIPTVGVSLEQAADLYQATLQKFYGADRLQQGRPLFDVVLLGLGADGHTASLLPGRAEQNEVRRWVCPVSSGAPEPRITLTPPPLESCRAAVFLVSGAEKREAFARLRTRDPSIPASGIRPSAPVYAFVDGAAAS